ncbi:MAG: diguanylate cyclase [Candidatus Omnitrophica bacterium]|nr:diguanylate cyclase [Candidatus Omnitrophota bacterium]
MLNPANILIVDDNRKMLETLGDILAEEGYTITGVENIACGKEEIEKKIYNIALIDLKLPDGSGLELLREIHNNHKETLAIIFTGYASVQSSIHALNKGAFAYIQKPLNIDELKIAVKNALEMQKLIFANKRLVDELKELSIKDDQTKLYNYRYLMERLAAEANRARRYGTPLSVLMLDIDYFKSINDVYGHFCGDNILKEFAQCLKDIARTVDIVARYGGEEFVIVLPDTPKEGVVIFAERLLDAIGKHLFDPEGKKIRLSVSIGIASFQEDGSDAKTASGLINLADKALLHAKEMGGNKLCTSKDVGKDIADMVEKGEKENVVELRKKLSRMADRVARNLLESVYAFSKNIKARDFNTGEHSEKMVSIVTRIGEELKLSSAAIKILGQAAILHDLGKVGIPDEILHKKGKLSNAEYEIIKRHTQIGAEILRPIHFLDALIPVILYHHERFDGLGYPDGLKGKDIPLGARIVALADVYEVLVSDRPYRKAYSEKDALDIIRKGSGTQFDPEIVDVFIAVMQARMDNGLKREAIKRMKKILIIDDDKNNLITTRDILHNAGFDSSILSDPMKAEEFIEEKSPDLIIMDLLMPRRSGLKILEDFKNNNIYQDIPKIILTAMDNSNDKKTAYEYGVKDYAIKPLEPEELIAKTKYFIAERSCCQ